MDDYSRSSGVTERDFGKEKEVAGGSDEERDGRGWDIRPDAGRPFVEGRV